MSCKTEPVTEAAPEPEVVTEEATSAEVKTEVATEAVPANTAASTTGKNLNAFQFLPET